MPTSVPRNSGQSLCGSLHSSVLRNSGVFSAPWSQEGCGSAQQLETSAACSQCRQLQEVLRTAEAEPMPCADQSVETVTERSTTTAVSSQGLAPFHQGFVGSHELLEEGGLQESQPLERPLPTLLQQGRE